MDWGAWKGDIIESIARLRGTLRECAERIPDGQEGFTPWPGAKSLGGLIVHLMGAQGYLEASLDGGTPEPLDENVAPGSKAEIISLVDARTARLLHRMAAMPPDSLAAEGRLFGRSMPVWQMLRTLRDHEIHHRGQVATYLRLVGATPPRLTF